VSAARDGRSSRSGRRRRHARDGRPAYHGGARHLGYPVETLRAALSRTGEARMRYTVETLRAALVTNR
jgi:hypothetical protein